MIAALVVACTESPGTRAENPTAPPNLNDAESAARSFLEGWTKGDYDAMYGLITRLSLRLSKEAFTQKYEEAEQTLNLVETDAKSFEILSDQSQRQGSTAIIRYNMTFNSLSLGKFTDPDRTMRLVIEPRGWRVAWSTMDIFEGMAGGAILRLNRTVARRGSIFDRNDRIIAQDGVVNYAVRLLTRAYPPGSSPKQCYRTLAEIFRVSETDLAQYEKFLGVDNAYTIGTLFESDYEALKPRLDKDCLLLYTRQTTRFYYNGGIGAQTVGLVGAIQADQVAEYPQLAPGALVGQYGIERTWQSQLGGAAGAELVIMTPDNVLVRTIYTKDATPGQDVHLTLDREMQMRVEQAISSAYNAANWAKVPLPAGLTRGAGVVVLDVKTGAVLAMASYPFVNPDAWQLTTTFEADTIATYNRRRATVNHATEETFPPGSVMKIASTAAAQGSGEFRPTELVDCKGTFTDPDDPTRIRTDWIYLETWRKQNYHGIINLQQGLTASCDVYFWTIGQRLTDRDPSLIRKFGNQLGLGVKTGIDSIAEQAGVIPDPDWKRANIGQSWGYGDSLNIVIGQGDVQVTVLQVARMMVGVANGQSLYKPHLVRSVGYPNQPPTYQYSAPTPETLGLAPEVLDTLHKGLCEVITNKDLGTAQWVFYNWDHAQVEVCGKTGTAQSGQAYPHGWFVAYAGKPGEMPDIAIAAVTLYSREGSETSAPIVRRIIESYYGLRQEPWPAFWSQPYELLPPPGLGEGGPPKQ